MQAHWASDTPRHGQRGRGIHLTGRLWGLRRQRSPRMKTSLSHVVGPAGEIYKTARHDVVGDKFEKRIKKELAARSGHRCSRPACLRPTHGPRLGAPGYVNVGVAAHITAASPGGPRYDSTLTAEQRGSAENGIWLCKVCEALVDADSAHYRVEILGVGRLMQRCEHTLR